MSALCGQFATAIFMEVKNEYLSEDFGTLEKI